MKIFLSLIVLGIFCTDSANSYISSAPPGGTVPWNNGAKSSFAQPPSNVDLDDIFREEYLAWAKRYGKSTDDSTRFENFKLNFMLQMQQNKKTGTFSHLNEFGDMTAQEFESGKTIDNVTNNNGRRAENRKELSDNVVEVELIMDDEPIPRVTPIGTTPPKPNYSQQQYRSSNRGGQRVSYDVTPERSVYSGRDDNAHSSYTRPWVYGGSRDHQQRTPSGPRLYSQDQAIGQPPKPRRRRRLVRVGPDEIL